MADRAAPLLPDDLERAATAAYLAGHDRASTELWTRAHQAHLDRGEAEQAVRCAFWLGFGLVQRGEMAQGGGWLARAHSLVDQHALDCVEQGYLLLPEALMAAGSGHPEAALARFGEVAEVAGRFGDADLAAVVAELDGDARAALEAEVVERCQPFVDGDATVMEPGLLLATGRRPVVDRR